MSPGAQRGGEYDGAVRTLSNRRVLLIGAGGHARVCLEALLDMDDTDVVGAVSADGTGITGLGVPMLGMQADLKKVTQRHAVTAVCVAIGDNSDRQRLTKIVTESGSDVTLAISRFAMLSTSASCGDGVQLLAGSVVNAATDIGAGTIVNTNASIDHDCHVGEFVHVAPGATIGGGVTIGELAFIGLGSRVLPGLTIGASATIGAGAVVIADVPPGATVVGVPARRLDVDGRRS